MKQNFYENSPKGVKFFFPEGSVESIYVGDTDFETVDGELCTVMNIIVKDNKVYIYGIPNEKIHPNVDQSSELLSIVTGGMFVQQIK